MNLMAQSAARHVYALNLLSGGLDSRLAACVLSEQGVHVHGVCFESPFFSATPAREAAAQLGIPLHTVDFTADIVSLLDNPKHGFGSRMNPCIDCHAAMIRRADCLRKDLNFHCVATGEVLDQRPMSQNWRSLDIVARESGCGHVLLRPLSARLLPETEVEKLGFVDRSRLLSLSGRGRKEQIRLAKLYGLDSYPSPAGGCRLTEPGFCRRLKDLRDHEGLGGRRALELLRHGRHVRLTDSLKLVVGRHEQDNAVLEGGAELYDLVLRVKDYPGPTGILSLMASEQQIAWAAAICARYSDAPRDREVGVQIRSAREVRVINVRPANPADIEKSLV